MKVFEWTYFLGGDGRGQWPGAWLARGKTLRENAPLNRGWSSLEKSVKAAQEAQREAIQSVQGGRLTLSRYLDAEGAFLKVAAASRSGAEWQRSLATAWTELANRKATVDALVADLRQKTSLAGEVTLELAYKAVENRIRAEAGKASDLVRKAMLKQKAAADAAASAATGPASEFTLYRDLQRKLSGFDVEISSLMAQALPPSEQAQLADLDLQSLKSVAGGPSFEVRYGVYRGAMQLLAPGGAAGESLLGRLAETAGAQVATLAKLRETVEAYAGPRGAEFGPGARNLLEAASSAGVQGFVQAYQRELDSVAGPEAGFPLGRGPALSVPQFKESVKKLERAKADAAAQGVPADLKRGLEQRFERAAQALEFAQALIGADGEPQVAKLLVVRDRDQAPTIEKALGAAAGSRQALARVYPSLRVGGKDFRPRGLPESAEMVKLAVSESPPPLEFSTTVDPKPSPDATYTFGGAWGVLRLIQQGSVRRAEGREWDGVVRVRESGAELALAVTVVFDRGLPPLERWPGAR